MLMLARQAQLLTEMVGVLVDREARRGGRDLEQDSLWLPEVDRVEVVAVDDRRHTHAGVTGARPPPLVIVVPGLLGTFLFILGTPLAGLAVWLRGDEDDGDDDGDDPPPVDWGEFEGAFWTYVRSRRRPRTPAGR